MANAISLQQVGVTFPRRGRAAAVPALLPLDLEVPAGRLLGVLGPNGSGKTTMLRVLAGLHLPTQGTANVLGLPAHDPSLPRRVAFVADGPPPFGVLSAREYLAWTGARLGLPNAVADARSEQWLQRLGLAHAGRRWVRTFSTGMQKRLSLAAAMVGQPEVLLLDEPTSGLDPLGSAAVMTILRELAAAGTTILMASHHLLEVEEICDEVLVLQDGRQRARGTLAELLGTDAHAVVVRGLDAGRLQQFAAQAEALGGEVVRIERERSHLWALFRRFSDAGGSA
jgi:ABC-2 type transport system ATP-binding protein